MVKKKNSPNLLIKKVVKLIETLKEIISEKLESVDIMQDLVSSLLKK